MEPNGGSYQCVSPVQGKGQFTPRLVLDASEMRCGNEAVSHPCLSKLWQRPAECSGDACQPSVCVPNQRNNKWCAWSRCCWRWLSSTRRRLLRARAHPALCPQRVPVCPVCWTLPAKPHLPVLPGDVEQHLPRLGHGDGRGSQKASQGCAGRAAAAARVKWSVLVWEPLFVFIRNRFQFEKPVYRDCPTVQALTCWGITSTAVRP